MGICWPFRTKTLAHEMRRGGARRRLANAIARDFRKLGGGSITCRFDNGADNWEVPKKLFPTTQRTMAGHWFRVAPITRDQWTGQNSAVNNDVHSMIRQGRNGPGCNLRYKWEESITHYRQLERFNRCTIGDHNRSAYLNNLASAMITYSPTSWPSQSLRFSQ